MGRFRNLATGVVVSVADSKDSRFESGWTTDVDGVDAPDEGGAPRGNASREAWAVYAGSVGVEVHEDASRDEIKAAISAAQHTE